MTGLTRARAASVIAAHFGTAAGYDNTVTDTLGRKWRIVSDGSIHATYGGESVELVSPICVYSDIEVIQEIIRKLRAAGAISDAAHGCGIHIHINAAPHTPATLRNLANIMASKEDLLYKALNIDGGRASRYCKKVDGDFIKRLNGKKPKTLIELKRLWYNDNSDYHQHYDDSRYHGLNYHAIYDKGTIEFRLFNGTTHAGKIRAYLQMCLAISHQAMTQKSASATKTVTTNDKYTFRTWLLRLGLIGDEFKTARQHLLANLKGNTAWRNGVAA
jgi:hypothetical protein